MDYIYKPKAPNKSSSTFGRRYAYHPQMRYSSPGKLRLAWRMPQFEIPWQLVRVVVLCICLAGSLVWGGTKARAWAVAKQDSKKAQAIAQQEQEHANKLAELNSSVTGAMEAIRMGEEKQNAGNLEEAKISYEIALQYEPNLRDALLKLGVVELMQKDYKAAEESIGQALSLDPIYPPTHHLLSILYSKTNRAEDANSADKKAVGLANQMGLEIGG